MVLLNKICRIPRKFYEYVENISIENSPPKNYKTRFKNQMKTKKGKENKLTLTSENIDNKRTQIIFTNSINDPLSTQTDYAYSLIV